MKINKIMLASGNQGKLAELTSALQPLDVKLVLQPEQNAYEIAETGIGFIENALLKARHAAKLSGLPTIADDSGLMVDALNGQPGVKTARFAGEPPDNQKNMNLLLEKMHGKQQRDAQFCCVLVFVKNHNDPLPIVATGTWQGTVAEQQLGTEGFGYDPIFFVASHNQTAAQLTPEQKQQLSHRGKAVRELTRQLKTCLAGT